MRTHRLGDATKLAVHVRDGDGGDERGLGRWTTTTTTTTTTDPLEDEVKVDELDEVKEGELEELEEEVKEEHAACSMEVVGGFFRMQRSPARARGNGGAPASILQRDFRRILGSCGDSRGCTLREPPPT